ncbi:response regulator transcription factor [Paenibacillus thermotolerans]|uniref:response regulator transcription factor n=1 Tax=Paenibacillus thermotolerans TaxID=3027807 RepID=UPI002368D1F3|nr:MULTISPECIES: response regulator transcription factor [unclassified Paenibacillus]
MSPVRLLLADDQELIRESLHIVLEMDPELEVAGMAENGRVAVEVCERERPDIILMDLHMPEMDGVEATRTIKQRFPEVKIIILTTFQEVQYVVDALGAGAEGYLLKAIHPRDLAEGIKWVYSGGTLIPQDIALLLVSQLQGKTAAMPATAGTGSAAAGPAQAASARQEAADPSMNSAYGLSERELQVLHCIADGLNNREIAERLFLSEGTVKNYISAIYSKMEVRDRIGAARKAQSEGLV